MITKTKRYDNNFEITQTFNSINECICHCELTDNDIYCVKIEGDNSENDDFSREEFYNTIISDCEFINCSFDACEFTNVMFKNCMFVSCSMRNTKIHRCNTENTKFKSCIFDSSDIVNSDIISSGFVNSNLTETGFVNNIMNNADFTNTFFNECKLTRLTLKKCLFIGTEFYHTSLKSVDFTDSTIESITLPEGFSDLKGAIVNPTQAADLAQLLGVVVKY